MDLYDQHLHSRHSFDSKADPAANVRIAIDRGLAGLTFTEHFDAHPDDWNTCVYDDKAYTATIKTLRSRFGGEIFIGKGIEVCFQPARMAFILDFLSRHKFDLVLLSVHYFGDQPVHVKASWEGVGTKEGTQRYLETVLEATRYCERLHDRQGRVFDVLGHLDFVKRYTRRFRGEWAVDQFGDLIDEILGACLVADLIPEVNTSTLRQGLEEPMPGQDTLIRYARLGGSVMSLGSDAHRCEDVGAGLDDAVELLRAAGLKGIAVFKDRTRDTVSVE